MVCRAVCARRGCGTRTNSWHAGDIFFFHGLGYKVLVINSMKAITDLFEKRHSIYSDRPAFTVVGELMRLGQVRRGARRAPVLS